MTVRVGREGGEGDEVRRGEVRVGGEVRLGMR